MSFTRFADDARLYSNNIIFDVDDCDSLQSDPNCVYGWANTINMILTPKIMYPFFSTNVAISLVIKLMLMLVQISMLLIMTII